jgi:hypothetical protein
VRGSVVGLVVLLETGREKKVMVFSVQWLSLYSTP